MTWQLAKNMVECFRSWAASARHWALCLWWCQLCPLIIYEALHFSAERGSSGAAYGAVKQLYHHPQWLLPLLHCYCCCHFTLLHFSGVLCSFGEQSNGTEKSSDIHLAHDLQCLVPVQGMGSSGDMWHMRLQVAFTLQISFRINNVLCLKNMDMSPWQPWK